MLTLGSTQFPNDRMLIMAIINRTPDSFYDRGATYSDGAAHDAVDRAIAEGADIIDIGGVKAGPGPEVTTAEEIRRTAPFVSQVRDRYPEVVISVDTWRAEVGEAVCAEGVDLLNDAWGGFDTGLAEVAAQHKVGLVCTHTGAQAPRTRPHHPAYADLVGDIIARTTGLAARALRLGVPRESILIDPGHDFGKITRQSLLATRATDRIAAAGWPLLMSLSRKDFVGESIGKPDPADRLLGTLAATAVTAWLGARVWRTHDVAETRQVLDMVACIKGDREPEVERRGLV